MVAIKKHYSSDRISTLIGNGCFVLNEDKNKYSDFFDDKKELINFRNEKDLVNKILFFNKNTNLRKKISQRCYKKYHSKINTKKIIKYVLDILTYKKIKDGYPFL